MVGTAGILSNIMRSPSPECYTTFWMMTIYSNTFRWSNITPIFDPVIPSSISFGWVVIFIYSHRTVFTFRSWLDLLGVVLKFWISIQKIFKSLQTY